MKELGGTLICFNALKYDYCLKEAIESLVACCDEVVVLDCFSNDGTTELVRALMKRHDNLYMFQNKFDVAPNYERLSRLTNIARDYLDAKWHLNLQADEVLREDAFPIIRQAIKSGRGRSYSMARLNFWGDQDHYFRETHVNPPVSPTVIRLASRDVDSIRDAESLQAVQLCRTFERQIKIFHYGFIRDRVIMLDKILDMQQWFGLGQDKRVIQQKRDKGVFDPWAFVSKEALEHFSGSHPKCAQKWLRDHARQWR